MIGGGRGAGGVQKSFSRNIPIWGHWMLITRKTCQIFVFRQSHFQSRRGRQLEVSYNGREIYGEEIVFCSNTFFLALSVSDHKHIHMRPLSTEKKRESLLRIWFEHDKLRKFYFDLISNSIIMDLTVFLLSLVRLEIHNNQS